MWIRKHSSGVVVCTASNQANLHSAYGVQLGLSEDYSDEETDKFTGSVGDTFDGTTATAVPANRPVYNPTAEELTKQKIEGYKLQAARDLASKAADVEVVTEIDKELAKLP